jgi:FTO C-terminal domain
LLRAELKHKPVWNTSVILEAQAVLTEVEFEWIAQYWVQGAQHDVQHVWWQAPMRALEEAWGALEKLTYKVVYGLLDPKTQQQQQQPDLELWRGMLTCLTTRRDLRVKWDERRANKIYKRRIARPYQPVERPVFDGDHKKKRLPKDLTESLQLLSRSLAELENNHNSQETLGRSTSTFGSANSTPAVGKGKQKMKHFKHHASKVGVARKPKK